MKEKIIIKSPKQIEGIRKASNLTARTLDMIGEFVKAGISTEELDNICNEFILKNGGISACIGYHGFPKYTCISLNDTVCHGIPSKGQVLKEGDILNIDVTSIVDGYFGDASRMFTVGEITLKSDKLIKAAHDAWKIGIEQIKPGNHFGDIGYYIARHVEPLGYSIVMDYTGHGVGINFHEAPHVFHKAKKGSGEEIKPGMIFTVEPMINVGKHQSKLLKDNWTVKTKDGSFSAQWEHTILVTETGYEILTKTDKDFGFKY
ncbi:MAG: type I methionyl aminopeptidase [Candidatus Gracilibacteria bacterium]|nr:type I methionyl aminopeptidase [Candidatus Gracilibacteria bacterium]